MKKINIFLFILLAVVFQSCLKDDKDKFPISASSRIEARLLENSEVLKSAKNGWLMKYYPESHQIYGGYNILVKFDDQDKVTVMTERGGSKITETSLYGLIADNGPVVTFNTNNELFHYYSMPENPDRIGPIEGGMLGDYEFVIMDAKPEQVILKGKKTNNKIVMTPIPMEQSWEALMDEYLATDLAVNGYYAYEYSVNGEQAYVFRSFRNFLFTQNIGGKDVSFSMGYIDTKDGIEFYEPITLGGVEVHSMTFFYDKDNPYFEDATTGAKLKVLPAPLSRLLVSGKWYFSIKNMGSYGAKYWKQAYDERMKPRNFVMHSIFLGRDNNQFGMSYLGGTRGYVPQFGMYYFNYEIVDDNTFRTNWTGFGGGTFVLYGILYKMNLVIHPISNSPDLTREFDLTTDDVLKPSWIKLQDVDRFNNSFKLFKDVVVEPFLN